MIKINYETLYLDKAETDIQNDIDKYDLIDFAKCILKIVFK